MTPKERIMSALKLEEPDRVPLMLWGLDAYSSPRDPSYKRLLEYLGENAEIKRKWSPTGRGMFFSAAEVDVRSEVKIEDGVRTHESIIETPKGQLKSLRRAVPGTSASAEIKRYISSKEDVDKFLSMPYDPLEPDVSSFFRVAEELGDRGVVTMRTSDPMGVIGGIFDPEDFVLTCLLETEIITTLLDTMFERIFSYYKRILEGGARPIFIIQGPEYITPPLLPPEYFDIFVVNYDYRLIQLVHDYGCLVIVHCHGNLDEVLEKFVQMGADGLHPIESPPMGDVTLAEAKRRVGDRICFVGNVQIGDMFSCTREEMAEKCIQVIRDGGKGGGLILSTTATPYETPLSDRTFENYKQLVETGVEYGVY